MTAQRFGSLRVYVHPDRVSMGGAAAAVAASGIKRLIDENGVANVLFSSAVSQLDCLDALASDNSIDWNRVVAFHVDEYAGMPITHPASFRRFLLDKFLFKVAPREFHGIAGESPDAAAECVRYAVLLNEHPPGLTILGIGENGHLAFNDPPVDFKDPFDVKPVTLDEKCRRQQVNDGAFASIEEVPPVALTVTISRLMRVPRIVCVVPGVRKSEAVKRTLLEAVSPDCPSSILRTHPNAELHLDAEAASLLDVEHLMETGARR
ncbi:MAG: glucosamine-6-phosphate deaminase [Bryobacteraceae bacterium]|nr:glucosamine-6-phosphate deaminase [Bryobacteraceae bacterium]